MTPTKKEKKKGNFFLGVGSSRLNSVWAMVVSCARLDI